MVGYKVSLIFLLWDGVVDYEVYGMFWDSEELMSWLKIFVVKYGFVDSV